MEPGQHHWWERILAGMAATRFGGWIVLNVTTRIDPFLMRASRGSFSLGNLMGTPVLLLTTIGAKTGQRRTVPLCYVRDGSNLALIGSATGIQHNPGWVYNLRKHPKAEIFGNRISGTYIAREAEGEERDRLWQCAIKMYPGYDAYQERASNRRIPVMVLEPQDR